MMRAVWRCVGVLGLIVGLSLSIRAEGKGGDLTLPDIYSGAYSALTFGYNIRPLGDGVHYSMLTPDRSRIVKCSYRTGKEVATLFDCKSARDCDFDHFDNYLISDNGLRIIILRERRGIYRRSATYKAYHYDVRRNRVEPLSKSGERLRDPLFSPDGRMAAYIINNDIYITKFDYNTEVRVTTDGAVNKVLNGATDWVYEEELYATSLMTWSDDSQYLCFLRSDESKVKTFDMTIFGRGNYPYTYEYKYPKAGEANSEVSLRLYQVDNRKTVTLDLGLQEEYYVPRIDFFKGSFYIFTLNRHQNHLRTFQVNPASKVAKLWLEEKDEWYIDSNSWVRELLFDESGVYYVSERSGRPQLYRLGHNGVIEQQLTEGDYDVDTFYGVTKQGEVVYSLCYPTPMDRTIFALDKRGRRRALSPEGGSNSATFSSDLSYYLLMHQSTTEVPTYELRETKGAKQMVMMYDNAPLRERLKGVRYSKKEFTTIRTKSGVELNAWILKPLDFDPNKQYPLVMTQYSGPGSQEVRNKFSLGWDEYMAQEGFIVACVDGRGTGGRGSHFKKQTYLKMGLMESQDQIEAAQALAELPYVDGKRMGIFGWSFGGYTVLMSMMRGEGTFASGVAVAPPTDWALYDTIYTERYMRTPQENPKGYHDTAVLSYVDKLQGDLLIVQGTADDNVHMQNTMLLTERLIAADKDYRMLIYTDKDHSIYGGNHRNHLFRQITNHFKRSLQ